MKLLTTDNAKTPKGEALGYLTGILYLTPTDIAGRRNVCPYASPLCRAACLYTAGRGRMTMAQEARIRRTRWYFDDNATFRVALFADIRSLIGQARRRGLKPAVRINGTSDLYTLAKDCAEIFPDVQFYDYTKIPKPWTRISANYHLTFSLSENNHAEAIAALAHGINVAVVMHTPKGADLPTWWNEYPVLDGDVSDARYLDKPGHVIGLRAKGKAIGSSGGFVQGTTRHGRERVWLQTA